MTTPHIASAPLIAVADAKIAGAVVYWTGEGSVQYARLTAAWVASSLDDGLLPSPVTPLVALHRALKSFCDATTDVRPLRGDRTGYVLVTEHYTKSDPRPTYTNGAEVTLREDGALAVSGADDPTAVYTTYERHRELLDAQDISHWLCALVRGVQSTRLRERGGVYFVPRHTLEVWRAYVAAIRSVSQHSIYEIPALPSSEAVRAILDAITAEAQETANDLLDDLCEGDFAQQRKVDSRKQRAAAMEKKLAQYEELLGARLDTMREKLLTIQAQYAAIILGGES